MMHDPRIGRFFAIDPLAPKYPHNSPYAFSENRVIDGVELEGLEYANAFTGRWGLKWKGPQLGLVILGQLEITDTEKVDFFNMRS